VVMLLCECDLDFCWCGFIVFVGTLNENGLTRCVGTRSSQPAAHRVSAAVIDELSAHFSRPDQKGAANVLRHLLERRGIRLARSRPVPLAQLGVTFSVGTDVACLLLGSAAKVERMAEIEDLDDLATAAKKEKCVAFATGADGTYAVRILGRTRRGLGPATTFPLVVRDDALTLTGVVGAGGTPTIPLAAGTYAAEVHCPRAGADYVVVLAPAARAPAWSFGGDLPTLASRSRG